MLESIVISGGPGGAATVDPGLLAEALIYYGRTRLILKAHTIGQLVWALGCDLFSELLSSAAVDITIQQQGSVTITRQTSSGVAFNYGLVAQSASRSRPMTPFEFVETHLARASGRRGWSRRMASSIMYGADIFELSRDTNDSTLASAAESDLSNTNLLRGLVGLVLKHKAPAYEAPQDWRCAAIPQDDGGYSIRTDLDLQAIEAAHVAEFPENKVFGVGDLVGLVIGMHEELRTQCTYSGDLQSDSLLRRLFDCASTHPSNMGCAIGSDWICFKNPCCQTVASCVRRSMRRRSPLAMF